MLCYILFIFTVKSAVWLTQPCKGQINSPCAIAYCSKGFSATLLTIEQILILLADPLLASSVNIVLFDENMRKTSQQCVCQSNSFAQ